MKKLLFSFIVLGITSILAIGATSAFFSDSKVVEGNTFTAGTLLIEPQGNTSVPITFTNLKPGDYNRKWITFRNVGSLPIGFLNVTKANISGNADFLTQIEISAQCKIVGGAYDYAFFTNDWGTPKPTIDTWFNNSDILNGPAYYRTAAERINVGDDYQCAFDFRVKSTSESNEYQGATASFDLVFTATQEI
jgi:predicted ribosomally synthesized peptide with SipW-like signal peptide